MPLQYYFSVFRFAKAVESQSMKIRLANAISGKFTTSQLDAFPTDSKRWSFRRMPVPCPLGRREEQTGLVRENSLKADPAAAHPVAMVKELH